MKSWVFNRYPVSLYWFIRVPIYLGSISSPIYPNQPDALFFIAQIFGVGPWQTFGLDPSNRPEPTFSWTFGKKHRHTPYLGISGDFLRGFSGDFLTAIIWSFGVTTPEVFSSEFTPEKWCFFQDEPFPLGYQSWRIYGKLLGSTFKKNAGVYGKNTNKKRSTKT